MAEQPEVRARHPRSPNLASTFEMMVPSGMEFTGRTLPTVKVATSYNIEVNIMLVLSRENEGDRLRLIVRGEMLGWVDLPLDPA